jgi:hypothetical protein
MARPAAAPGAPPRFLSEIGDGRFRGAGPCPAWPASPPRANSPASAESPSLTAGQSTKTSATRAATSPADSRRANPWAAKIKNNAIHRGKDHPHATRLPSRAWLGVIWHLLAQRIFYDPDRQGLFRALLAAKVPEADTGLLSGQHEIESAEPAGEWREPGEVQPC